MIFAYGNPKNKKAQKVYDKYVHYVATYSALAKEEKVPFMRELYKAALRRVEAGTDGDKVENWRIKIEKAFFKLKI